MKKYLLTVMAVAFSFNAFAQNQYDAANVSISDLNGTARYVGMGGALDALGGDISVMSSNPAGSAIYRKSDAAFTGSVLFTGESGQLGHDGSRASFDQLGAVFSFGDMATSSKGLQYINFGVNYQKKRNQFGNINANIDHLDGNMSQTNQIAVMANQAYNYYGTEYDRWGMLPDIATDADILQDDGTTYTGMGADKANYRRYSYGSTNQADFNVSFNVSNQFFWGVSLGVYDYNYNRNGVYEEKGMDGNYYVMDNWYETNGSGFDLKFGLICRPVKDSPFRFGVTIHTPTWYRLEDLNNTYLSFNDGEAKWRGADPYEYDYRTPWKFGLSLGHTIGKNFAIGAQYEISDLSSAKYSSLDFENEAYFQDMNTYIDEDLQTQHTFRLGMEYKLDQNWAFRCGYNYVSAPMKDNAWKYLTWDGYQCETDYTNWKGINRLTFGFGYRFNGGYFDMAYQYQAQKGDFYAFDDANLAPTEINNNRSQIMATLGFRF